VSQIFGRNIRLPVPIIREFLSAAAQGLSIFSPQKFKKSLSGFPSHQMRCLYPNISHDQPTEGAIKTRKNPSEQKC
jgi:hypothetical protein